MNEEQLKTMLRELLAPMEQQIKYLARENKELKAQLQKLEVQQRQIMHLLKMR